MSGVLGVNAARAVELVSKVEEGLVMGMLLSVSERGQ